MSDDSLDIEGGFEMPFGLNPDGSQIDDAPPAADKIQHEEPRKGPVVNKPRKRKSRIPKEPSGENQEADEFDEISHIRVPYGTMLKVRLLLLIKSQSMASVMRELVEEYVHDNADELSPERLAKYLKL